MDMKAGQLDRGLSAQRNLWDDLFAVFQDAGFGVTELRFLNDYPLEVKRIKQQLDLRLQAFERARHIEQPADDPEKCTLLPWVTIAFKTRAPNHIIEELGMHRVVVSAHANALLYASPFSVMPEALVSFALVPTRMLWQKNARVSVQTLFDNDYLSKWSEEHLIGQRLSLCDPYDVLHLGLLARDACRSFRKVTRIGMRPIGPDRCPEVFQMHQRNDDLVIDATFGGRATFLPPDTQIILRLEDR